MIVEGEGRYHYQTLMDYPWSSIAGGYALPSKKRAMWPRARGADPGKVLLADLLCRRTVVTQKMAGGEVVDEISGECGPAVKAP